MAVNQSDDGQTQRRRSGSAKDGGRARKDWKNGPALHDSIKDIAAGYDSGMIRVAGLIVLFALSAFGQRWESLFDGKSLNGWRVEAKATDQAKGFWKAVNGAIECDSLGRKQHNYVWLINEHEFGDFELRLKVMGFKESPGNSGVQVRSRWDASMEWLNGPQVDIHPPAPWRTGLIYDETRETRRWIYPSLKDWNIAPEQGPKQWKWNAEDWNDILITCKGGHIKTQVNGFTITDADLGAVLNDAAHQKRNAGMKGHIALQLHANDELKIRYKDIQVRELR